MTRPKPAEAVRLAWLVYLALTEKQGVEVSRIPELLGVAPRTARKYRDYLRQHFSSWAAASGRDVALVEVEDEEGKKWLRLAGEDAPRRRRATARIGAAQLSKLMLNFLDPSAIFAEAEQAARETKSRLARETGTAELLHDLDRKLYVIHQSPKDYRHRGALLEKLLEAVLRRRTIRIRYPRSSPKERRIEPWTMVVHRGALYLVARMAGGKAEPWLYAVDRIEELLDAEGPRFQVPADFRPASYFDGCFGIYRSPRAPYKVVLLFARDKALHQYIRERRWHPTQEIQLAADGRLRLSFQVRSLNEVAPWVRSFGRAVEVVSPRNIDWDGIGLGLPGENREG